MKLKNTLLNLTVMNKVNKALKKYKYVHLMYNDKFTKPFVNFLNRNLNSQENLILCKRWIKDEKKAPFPVGDNVIEIYSFFGLNFEEPNIKKIICHSLFDKEIVEYMYKHKNVLKTKAYWGIWGGDLYNAKRDKKNDYVRANFKGYIDDIDEEYARQKYSIGDRTFHRSYAIFPVTTEMLDAASKRKDGITRIQINNSADKSTLEMLDILSKFKSENVKITTVLSYGELDYKEDIIKKGKSIFAEKFEYLDNYMPPSDYAKYVGGNDILILNQKRQQGIGNTIASLYCESKVFIRSSVSVNGYFNKNGIRIYNSEDIANLNFEEFISNEAKVNSKNEVKKFFDENYLASLWQIILEAEE